MQIVEKKIIELKAYDKNPRKNDNAVEPVAESIKEFGFKVPIIIDSDGVIVAGHTRLRAAKKLGMKTVPCIVADDLTPEQIKAFRVADNSSAQIASWDLELLKDELMDLDFDMSLFGLDEQLKEIEREFVPEIIEDEVPEVSEGKAVAELGDIWQLGRHRLMCGDSTDKKTVDKLMGGGLADLVVTDPPYNVAYEGGTGMTIKNDNMESSKFLAFLSDAFSNLNNSLKEGGAFYVWFASREHINFESALKSNDLIVRQEIVWVKNSLVLGRQDYQWKHEPCLYGWKKGAAHYFTDDRTQTTVFEDKGIDFKKLKKHEAIKMLEDIFSDKISTTVINEDKPAISSEHPTMKPIKLLARLIRNSSRENETVLDVFGGSGSTLIACEQLNRSCYMMELDTKYCDVIIKRWENLTGEKAVKI